MGNSVEQPISQATSSRERLSYAHKSLGVIGLMGTGTVLGEVAAYSLRQPDLVPKILFAGFGSMVAAGFISIIRDPSRKS